jgi:hypothetical protein
MKYVLIKFSNKPNIHFNLLKDDDYSILKISKDHNNLIEQMKELNFKIKLKNIWLKICKAFSFYKDVEFDRTRYLVFPFDKLPLIIYDKLRKQ